MAKKTPAAEKPATDSSKQLLSAIVTVKHLQDFVQQHGGVDRALGAVVRVQELTKLTGGFDQLKQALEIVGKEGAPQS